MKNRIYKLLKMKITLLHKASTKSFVRVDDKLVTPIIRGYLKPNCKQCVVQDSITILKIVGLQFGLFAFDRFITCSLKIMFLYSQLFFNLETTFKASSYKLGILLVPEHLLLVF